MPTPVTISPKAGAQTYAGSLRTFRIGPNLVNASTADYTVTTSAAYTTLVATTTAAAAPNATTIAVSALAAAINVGATAWINGVKVVVTATAAISATSLTVAPLVGGIATGVTINFVTVAVTALPQPVYAGTTLTFNNGTRAKVVADAAAAGTLLYLQSPITGAIGSGATAVTNLFPYFDSITDISVSPPKGTAETLQFFGKAASQSKVSLAQQTFSVKTALNDFDSAVAIALDKSLQVGAPASTVGIIVQMGSNETWWGYADVNSTSTEGGATATEQKMFEFAIRELYLVPAYSVGVG